MFSKGRLEALSDGIFAIVMTLLVLDLKVPTAAAVAEVGSLPHALVHEEHAWVSFVLTFLIASIFWTLQHRVFGLIEGVHTHTLIPTFIFLGLVSVLPFSASLLGQYLRQPLAFVLYFLNEFAIAVALTVKLEVASAHGHLAGGTDASSLRVRLYSMCVVMAGAAASSYFLPMKFLWIAPLALGMAAKRFRSWKTATA